MTENGQDQDAMQWGLHVLDFFNSNYGPYCNQEDGSIYRSDYVRDYSCNTEHDSAYNYVEDNAIIQHNLQEEFSQLEVDNAAESSQTDAEDFHSSIVASNWLVPCSVNHYPGTVSDCFICLHLVCLLCHVYIFKLQLKRMPRRRQMIWVTQVRVLAQESDQMMVKIVLIV